MVITSVEEMLAFGRQIGASLNGGEVIELIGDVGAGKTTFVKGLATGMGITEAVQSPSFTINRIYDAPQGLRLAHYDFYRLDDPGIMGDELDEMLADKQSVVVIEWAQAVEQLLPTDKLVLTITAPSETERHVDAQATGSMNNFITWQVS